MAVLGLPKFVSCEVKAVAATGGVLPAGEASQHGLLCASSASPLSRALCSKGMAPVRAVAASVHRGKLSSCSNRLWSLFRVREHVREKVCVPFITLCHLDRNSLHLEQALPRIVESSRAMLGSGW